MSDGAVTRFEFIGGVVGAAERTVSNRGDAQAGFSGAVYHVETDVMQAAGAAADDADGFDFRRGHG